MHSDANSGASALRMTHDGVMLGVRLTLAALPGIAVVGAVVGTLAAEKGLTLFEAMFMSGIVFAGASQLASIGIWTAPLTVAAVTTIALVTAMVNMRLVLIGASLRPWLAELPSWQSYSILAITTDTGWLVGMRYHRNGGFDAGVLLGAGLAQYVLWLLITAVGYVFGSLLSDPQRFGLDLVFPVFFAAMLVPQWRGMRPAIPWAISGVVALIAERALGGYWFIVIGAVCGMIVGAFVDERD